MVILAVTMLVYIASASNKLTRWLNSPSLLFLGSISYGLYLLHPSIGWRLIALEKKIYGDDMNLLIASLAFLSGILISILAAWVMHILIEKPSMNFSHRIKLPRKETVH